MTLNRRVGDANDVGRVQNRPIGRTFTGWTKKHSSSFSSLSAVVALFAMTHLPGKIQRALIMIIFIAQAVEAAENASGASYVTGATKR